MALAGRGLLKILALLVMSAVMFSGFLPASGSNMLPEPMGPPYIMDSYFLNGGITVDGIMNEAEWTAPTTSVTKTTLITNGWNLTTRTFFNATSLFVGVELCGDTSKNPNDFLEICFDTDHDATALPDAADMKIVARGTSTGIDDYSLWYGNGAVWIKSSDQLNTPNPWPAGYAADGELNVNTTYEFRLPIAAAWGEAAPPNNDITGFTVHGYGQADNKHVWWPDNQGSGSNPATEYCNIPSTWGDLVYHASTNVPDYLVYVAGDGQEAAVGSILAQPVSVRVKNQTGGNVSDAMVNITFSSVPAGATGQQFVASAAPWLKAFSNAQGFVNFTVQLGSRPGIYWINATGPGFTGISGPIFINTLDETATIGALATLQARATPPAVAPTCASAVEVWANDSFGNGIAGLTMAMTFDSNPSGGSVSPTASDTGDGTYSAAYMAGSTGNVTDVVNATSGGKWGKAPIQVSALPPGDIQMSFSISIVSGNLQSGSISSVLPLPLVVEVRNQTSVLAQDVQVWFNISTGGGALSMATMLTQANGRASTYLTLGAISLINTITAQINASASVLFSAVATAPSPEPRLASNITSVVAGGSLIFILNADNNGTEAAKNVWVNLSLPEGLIYVSDSSNMSHSEAGGRISWLFPSLSVGSHSLALLCMLNVENTGSFTTWFDINCTSQSGIPMPRIVSNSVDVEILQNAGNNVPPIIDGVPDLIVHYDWDYTIDLKPYIFDADNEYDELVLTLSDTVNARVSGGMSLMLNYSVSLMGIPQSLNITVSDGRGSDWDVISVTVSDKFPPELVGTMPDLIFDEDEVYYGFNVTQYFSDKGGDSIYYSFGNFHLAVDVIGTNVPGGNYTLHIVPDANWFGQESITLRAENPTGALVEDTLLVTVLPVNDAPAIGAVPDQSGQVNVTWVLELNTYISDVDNALDQLTITVDSDYATVNGFNITFRCLSPVNDILTVTVSDGATQTYAHINVLAEPAAEIPDSLPEWLLPLAVIIIAVLSLLLIAASSRKPVIEQAFLIYRDGALLAHSTNRMIPEMDSQIFSSMLTAIQDFVKDSFKDETEWRLNKLEFGDKKMFIMMGGNDSYNLTLVYQGRDKGLEKISKNAVAAVDSKYGELLKEWNGDLEKLRGIRDVLTDSIFK